MIEIEHDYIVRDWQGKHIHPPFGKPIIDLAKYYVPRTDRHANIRLIVGRIVYVTGGNNIVRYELDPDEMDFIIDMLGGCSESHVRSIFWHLESMEMILKLSGCKYNTYLFNTPAVLTGRLKGIHAPLHWANQFRERRDKDRGGT